MKKLTLFLFVCITSLSSFAQWTPGGMQISISTDDHHRPFAASIPGGGAFFTWTGTSTVPLNSVYVSGYNKYGNILTGIPCGGLVASQPGDHYAPVVVTSEDASAIVAWYGYPTGQNRSHIYIQKFTQAGVAQWNGGNPVQVSAGTAFNHKYPIITADHHKGAYITWTRFDSLTGASSPDVYLQHIDSAGNVAAGWNIAGSEVAGTVGVREFYPRLALTPDDSALYILYPQGLVGNTSAKLKKMNTSDGLPATGWNASGLVLSPGPYVYPGVYNDMYLFCDDVNNAVCFWVESRSSANGEIYMQRVTPAATPLLTANGKCVGANTADGTGYLEIVKNEEGNFLLAYNDYATSYDVDAKKLSPDGTTLWQNLTVTTNGASAYPKPVSDGNKGMYIFYRNNSAGKLYALALDSLGVAYSGWTVPGTDFGAMSNYSGFNPNYDFDAVSTVNNEAIVVWNRQNGAENDIYACNLLPSGANCSALSVEEIGKSHMNIYPNPFSGELFVSGGASGQSYTFRLFDITGKAILQQALLPETQNLIHATGLSSGIYVYEIIAQDHAVQRGKLIRQ